MLKKISKDVSQNTTGKISHCRQKQHLKQNVGVSNLCISSQDLHLLNNLCNVGSSLLQITSEKIMGKEQKSNKENKKKSALTPKEKKDKKKLKKLSK